MQKCKFNPTNTPDLLHTSYEMVAALPLENVEPSETVMVADTRVIALDEDGYVFFVDLPKELYTEDGAVAQEDCTQLSALPTEEQKQITDLLRQEKISFQF